MGYYGIWSIVWVFKTNKQTSKQTNKQINKTNKLDRRGFIKNLLVLMFASRTVSERRMILIGNHQPNCLWTDHPWVGFGTPSKTNS